MKEFEIALPEEAVLAMIYVIRGKKVILDKDLAALYGVETKALKQQVKRNPERFPEDFMFELTMEEFKNLRSQNVTSSWGGSRFQPMAFTEQGVAMLSSVLNNRQAIVVNIQIIRAFIKMRELISTHKDILQKLEWLEKNDLGQNEKIALIFKYLRELENCKISERNFKSRKRIGFKP